MGRQEVWYNQLLQYWDVLPRLKFIQTEKERITEKIESNCQLEIDFFGSREEKEEAMKLMNLEIEAGTSWPFEETFPTLAAFSHYFMSHAAFVARVTNWADKSAR